MMDVCQGVHLQMCGEVLRYLGSDTCFHIWTYSLWLAQRRYPGFAQRRYHTQHYFHFHVPFPDVSQGVHLQMCGEVLRCLGSDTSAHIWTSPRSYVQQRLLQNFPDHPLLGLSIVLLSLVCLCWMTANESTRIDDGEGWE